MRFWVALGALLLCGCASWGPETIAEEAVQQAAQVVDLAQTLNIADHTRCLRRWAGGPLCQPTMYEAMSAWWIGAHPSDRSVYAMKASEMLLHLGATALLEQEGWKIGARSWELGTIGVQAGVDAHNASIGLQMRF